MWNFIVFFCHQQLWRNKDKNISVKMIFCCWGIYFSYEPHQWPGDPKRLQSSLTWAMYVGRNASKLWYELNQCSLTYYSLFKQRDWYTCTMSSMKYARFGFTDKAVFLRWSLVWDGLTPFLIDRSLSGVPSPFFSQLPCPRKRALLCIALLFTGSWHIARASWSVFWCHVS